MRVVLEEYLASMKERNELDALLPELLAAMGHEVLSKPQVGVRQGGVDCLSTTGSGSEKCAHLFIIKFGDIGRSGFYAGEQAIEPSVREACSDYLRTRVPADLKDCSKKIVVVTNGQLKQEVQQNWASLSHHVAEFPGCVLELWNEDKLLADIEEFLFDESLLLSNGKQHLRKAVAGLDEPEFAILHMKQFVDAALGTANKGGSSAALQSGFEKRCRAALAGWVVFTAWCNSEDNLKPAVIAGEYLLLRLWSVAIATGTEELPSFHERLSHASSLYAGVVTSYFTKVHQQLLEPPCLLRYAPEHPLYCQLVFDELGRVASATLVLTSLIDVEPAARTAHADLVQLLVHLVNKHTGCHLPLFDGHSVDISLGLCALASAGRQEDAKAWARNIVHRFKVALSRDELLPIDSDSLEDLYAVRFYRTAHAREYFRTTTVVPMLATFAADAQDQAILDRLATDLLPKMAEVTLERWFPTSELEKAWGPEFQLASLGMSRALSGIGPTIGEERDRSLAIPAECAKPDQLKCIRLGFSWLVALSARHYRHPLPTWFNSACRSSSTAEFVPQPNAGA